MSISAPCWRCLLHNEADSPTTLTHAIKNGKRYHFNTSRAQVTATRSQVPNGSRIAAGNIEQLVVDQLCTYLTNCSGELRFMMSSLLARVDIRTDPIDICLDHSRLVVMLRGD